MRIMFRNSAPNLKWILCIILQCPIGTLDEKVGSILIPFLSCLLSFVIVDGEMFGEMRDASTLLDSSVVILPQDQLRQVSKWCTNATLPRGCKLLYSRTFLERLPYWV